MPKLWGEFEDDKKTEEPVNSAIVKYFIMKAMEVDPFRSVTFPKPDTSKLIQPESDFSLEYDERVQHCVKLRRHLERMEEIVEDSKELVTAYLENPSQEPPILPAPLEVPFYSGKSAKDLRLFQDRTYSDFVLGKGLPVPKLEPSSVNHLLSKSVELLMQLVGFSECQESTLVILRDAAEVYLKKMVLTLRFAVDQGANAGTTGFPDALERVFADMGIGSVSAMQTYYENDVMSRHAQLMTQSRQVAMEYSSLQLSVKSGTMHHYDTIAKLEEPDSVPEIHFPAIGEDGVDELQSSLETGYQMLHSLEQEVQLQQLDIQDDSPGQDSYDVTVTRKRKRI